MYDLYVLIRLLTHTIRIYTLIHHCVSHFDGGSFSGPLVVVDALVIQMIITMITLILIILIIYNTFAIIHIPPRRLLSGPLVVVDALVLVVGQHLGVRDVHLNPHI